MEASDEIGVSGGVINGIHLLEGELLVVTDTEATYVPSFTDAFTDTAIGGTMSITNYRVAFQTKDGRFIVDLPLGNVHKVDKIGGMTSSGENAYGLEIHSKDGRRYRFSHPQVNHSRKPIYEKLHTLAFPLTSGNEIFAFVHYKAIHAAKGGPTWEVSPGWQVYDFEKEMARQGVPNDAWRICRLNEDYTFAPTYPGLFAAPTSMSDEEIAKVAAFRSKSRLPALSWISPRTKATITRCAQPRVGMLGKRSEADENYMQALVQATPSRAKVQIIDARPRVNAVANQAKGLGYEPAAAYPMAVLSFLNIHNIHVMRESLRKVKEICTNEVDNWHAAVDGTKWLKHVQLVLYGATRLARFVENGTSAMVHCSDGWDRTAQLTALAMLLVDPYYRTVEGFEVLIEKEWLSFGHKFQQRIGHGHGKPDDEQRSPIFVQFIDCVWQISQQHPCAFEFSETMLIEILDALYSCRFGTFLCNHEAKRREEKLATSTMSLWDHIGNNPVYRNPLYMPPKDQDSFVLDYDPSMKHIVLWHTYYARGRWTPQETPVDRLAELDTLLGHVSGGHGAHGGGDDDAQDGANNGAHGGVVENGVVLARDSDV
eukprot:m.51137 g.51137  ORF g.51137 m.51137 type:complete len:598 (-) comp7288_c0_seq1:1865-3658(-)